MSFLTIYLIIHAITGLLLWGWIYYSANKIWPENNPPFLIKIIVPVFSATLGPFGIIGVFDAFLKFKIPPKFGFKYW